MIDLGHVQIFFRSDLEKLSGEPLADLMRWIRDALPNFFSAKRAFSKNVVSSCDISLVSFFKGASLFSSSYEIFSTSIGSIKLHPETLLVVVVAFSVNAGEIVEITMISTILNH